MTNGLKQQKLTVNIETMPYYSASMADMHISPVSRVVLGLPEAACFGKLEISVVGKCGDEEFIRRCDFVKDCFSPESYNLKNSSSVVLEFDYDCFEYNKAFLNSLEDEEVGEIYVLANYCGAEFVAKSEITLLPSDMWLGLDGEPSVVCSFIREDDRYIEKICSDICENGRISYIKDSRKSIVAAIKELHKRIKSCNIIYTRPVGYAANVKQRLRSPEQLFSSGSVLATPAEIALIFCTCAKKMGLDTSLVFVRGSKGEISVLCGVYLVKSPFKTPVCEDVEKICSLVEAGDMIIVDPSVFAAAQDTSFVLAVENTSENFLENSRSLVCLVDVKCSLAEKEIKKDMGEFENIPVKNVVASIYSSLAYTPAMQFLSGKNRSEMEEIPLLVTDFDKLYKDEQTSYKLLPLDINVKLDEYAPIDKGFSSIVTKSSPKAKQHFSESELVKLRLGFEKLKARVSSDSEITTTLRDEELYRACTEMTFGKNKREPAFVFGYIKITDKLTETVSFAPMSLVRAKLRYESGNFYVNQYGNPIVNKVFIRNSLKNSMLGYDSFMKSLMPNDKDEIFDMFENIRMALSETDDRHVYEIIKEVHLVNVNIDDFILWSSLALERGKLSSNDAVKALFGKDSVSEKINKEYVPVKPMFSEGMKAVCNDTSMVVEGAYTGEKEEVLCSMAARSVTEGKSMLIVTDDMEMSGYVNSLLENAGLSEISLVVDESCNKTDLIDKISTLTEKYKNAENNGVAFVSKDLVDTEKLLCDYTERINKQHISGMSLNESVKSYLSASRGTENYANIPINREILDGADEAAIDKIFEISGSLITNARKLCKRSGLEKHTPIGKHPLFHTNPDKNFDEEMRLAVNVAIDSAIPVISEYRDVFSDVNEILKFEENEIDCFYKLEKLNELFKLILSSRDVDIPEKFVESDIADFVRVKKIAEENKKRMTEIEEKLSFFSPEIFEDIENLLKGNEYEEDEDAGFIKRFVTKKNGIDKLMQYIEAENKQEFQQHKLPEIYKLLYEYKACVVSLRVSNGGKNESEQARRLAQISDKADYLVTSISSSEKNYKKLLSNVFRLISVIPVDSNLARKMTVVRARLSELYSGENSAISIIAKHMGICFDDIVFESGILSFDGLGKYLEEIEKKLDCTRDWITWLEKSKEAASVVPEFVSYIEEHGAGGNIDRIFAKSLLAPISDCIRQEVMQGFSAEKLSRAKEKYAEYLDKACEISAKNTFESYKNVVRHAAQLYTKTGEEDAGGFREYVAKNASFIQRVVPIFVVTKNILTEALDLEVMFDTVVVIDNRNNGYSMLPALGFGHRFAIFNMSKAGASDLCIAAKRVYPSYNVSTFGNVRDVNVFTWLNSTAFNENAMCINPGEENVSELVRMNGIYDRTVTRTNKTESELSMVKATSLLMEGEKRVAVTAFTKQQCTAMEKLMHVLSKKNKVLSEALRDGRISVCTPDRLYMKKYDSLVVSACFGADKDARLGWDFGYAGKRANESVPEAYYCIADRMTEKTYILTSLNVKDSRFMKRTGNNAAVFNSFCEMLSDGRIPVNMRNAKQSEDEGILCEIMACISSRNPSVSMCEGKTPMRFALKGTADNGSYILLDNERGINMHDELLVKKYIQQSGKLVITITPMQLTGRNFEETVESLVNEKDNI